jgi:hypothetical protein
MQTEKPVSLWQQIWRRVYRGKPHQYRAPRYYRRAMMQVAVREQKRKVGKHNSAIERARVAAAHRRATEALVESSQTPGQRAEPVLGLPTGHGKGIEARLRQIAESVLRKREEKR